MSKSRVVSSMIADLAHRDRLDGTPCPRNGAVVPHPDPQWSGHVQCDCGAVVTHRELRLLEFLEQREAEKEVSAIGEGETEYVDGHMIRPFAEVEGGGRVLVVSPADDNISPIACEARGADIVIHRFHPMPAVIAAWPAALADAQSVSK